MRTRDGDVARRTTAPHGMPDLERPVVALVPDAAERAAVRAALHGRAGVEFCELAQELVPLANRVGGRVVVAQPRDAAGAPTAPALQALRADPRGVRIVLWMGLTLAAVRDLAEVGGVTVALEGHDDLRRVLHAVLDGAPHDALPGKLLAETAALVPHAVRGFVEHCALRAPRVRTARAAAEGAGIAYRTLARRLRVAGLPTPKAVLIWYCLLHAAWYMTLRGATRDGVAKRAGFRSGVALSDALRRYAHLSWTELRTSTGFGGLLARFQAILSASAREAPGAARSTRWRTPRGRGGKPARRARDDR